MDSQNLRHPAKDTRMKRSAALQTGMVILGALGLLLGAGCGPKNEPPPTCTDGVQNDVETDVDCGGGTCPACADGKACSAATDCASGVCGGGICLASTCADGVKNGSETDSDCGGGACPGCAAGKACAAGTDCASRVCSGGTCQASICTDDVKNGSESDVDCGGGSCPGCVDGKVCRTATDCASGVCTGGVCKPCSIGAECASGVCTAGVCQPPTCTDREMNGSESDVDCGGGTCPGCANGQRCAIPADCLSGSCVAQMCLPPDPAAVAPAIDPTVPTGFDTEVGFLYGGRNPIQTGVAPGSLDPKRVAVLRGKVLDRAGAPISGVEITALGYPELGHTYTRADGAFDLAVNGGGPVTLSYQKSGLLPLQRQLSAPWRDFAWAPDVVMIALDGRVTAVDLGSSTGIQLAQGNPVTDADGNRQATMLFSPGTTAAMTVGQSTQVLSSLHVRATEYTVGNRGPQAMPGELPPSSGYTYAVELSADEGLIAGATEVKFSKPVITYLDNFLNFPAGSLVPVGYYDRSTSSWAPSPHGLVIQVLSVTAGLADLDVDGSSTPASAAALAALEITDAERQQIAGLYLPGKSLWRVPIAHFSPWDFNWPYTLPTDAARPAPPPPEPKAPEDPCEASGSVIGCEGQTLGERLPVNGTPFTLTYQSDRAGTFADSKKIPVTGAQVPSTLKRIELELQVGGRSFKTTLQPSANLGYDFAWDGLDAYGRKLEGAQKLDVRIGYVYDAVYASPTSPLSTTGAAQSWFEPFYLFPAGPFPVADRMRNEISLWSDWFTAVAGDRSTSAVGAWTNPKVELGGWSLSAHHVYNPETHALYLGDGRTATSGALAGVIADVVGNGAVGFPVTGVPATESPLGAPVGGLAVAPDGTLFLSQKNCVLRIGADGMLTVYAGGCANPGFSGDSGPATQAQLDHVGQIALGPDGSLYIADGQNFRVRRVDPSGILTTVAGNGTAPPARCNGDDDGPATQVSISPISLAVGRDGRLYVGDAKNKVRAVGANGIIHTVVGRCAADTSYAGPAVDGALGTWVTALLPSGLAVGPDNSLFVYDGPAGTVWRIESDGILHTFAGGGPCGASSADGAPAAGARLPPLGALALGADGSLLLSEVNELDASCQPAATGRVRRVTLDGKLTTVAGIAVPFPAGGEKAGPPGNGGSALQAIMTPGALALGPDGSLNLADANSGTIRRVRPPPAEAASGNFLVPAQDGREIYVFDSSGRHLQTLDALTGRLRYRFGYDGAGALASVTDGDGNVTTVSRNTAGLPTAIVASGGQTTSLALDANGYLSGVTDPAGATTLLGADSRGLLTSLTDPGGGVHHFSYDAAGRLLKDENPAGGFSALSRSALDGGQGFQIEVASALGRTSTFQLLAPAGGGRMRINTSPAGAITRVTVAADGSQSITRPDGTVVTTRTGPDARFGMLAPIPASLTVTTPAGLSARVATSVAATLANPSDPTRLASYRETVTLNGQGATRSFDAATRQLTEASAAGRTTVSTLDAAGRLVSLQADPNLTPGSFSYDAAGRMTRAAQGGQSATYGYDAQGRLTSRTDAAGGVTRYGRDAAGRLTSVTLSSGRTFRFGYDANGNRTRVTMPGGAIHGLSYTATNLFAGYAPPAGGSYADQYDLDGALQLATLPSGRKVGTAYDFGGRMSAVTTSEATDSYSYADGTDRVASLTRTPAGGGSPQALDFTYDGSLLTGASFSGPAAGSFAYSYDANFFVVGMRLDAQPAVAIARDADGLVTGWGSFTFTRGGPAATTSRISDGTFAEAITLDSLGRLQGRTSTVGAVALFQSQLTYDSVGRIATKTETMPGTTHLWTYAYDADGQLTQVTRDGTLAEDYAYDTDGNRTRSTPSGTAEAASYDAQDQLVQRGSATYRYDADGNLAQRGGDAFAYGTRGELLRYLPASGPAVSYGYDGLRRRVSRSDAAGTTQFLYGNLSAPFQVTHERDPSGVLTAFYYDEGGRLMALERGGVRYYVGSDQVGTPRVIADASGAVLRAVEYDAFGRIVADSAPGFDLPVGFAGGLWDPASGLVRFGLRDYEPASGRWTGRDPLLFDGPEGNLYLYAGNNPLALRDPSGLFSIGGSLYAGLGAGGKISITSKGVSFCVEAGVGLGESVSVDPMGELDSNSAALKASAAVSAGKFGASLEGSLKLSECGLSKEASLGATVGPVSATADLLSGGVSVSGEHEAGEKGGLKMETKVGESAQIKASAQVCKQIKF